MQHRKLHCTESVFISLHFEILYLIICNYHRLYFRVVLKAKSGQWELLGGRGRFLEVNRKTGNAWTDHEVDGSALCLARATFTSVGGGTHHIGRK